MLNSSTADAIHFFPFLVTMEIPAQEEVEGYLVENVWIDLNLDKKEVLKEAITEALDEGSLLEVFPMRMYHQKKKVVSRRNKVFRVSFYYT